MKDPADLMISTTGPSRNQLKADIHGIAVALKFKRVRLGRYRREDCSVETARKLLMQAVLVESGYIDGTLISGFKLSAGVNVRIDLVRRKSK